MNKAELIATITKLKGERAEYVAKSDEILDKANAEMRSVFTPEEIRKMDESNTKADELTPSIEIYERQLKKIIDSEVESGTALTGNMETNSEESRGNDPVLDSEEYRTAFLGFLRGTVDINEVRTMANSTQGTVKAPTSFEMKFNKYLKDYGVMRKIATVIVSGTDKKYGFELGTGEAGWIDELGGYPSTDDEFGSAEMSAYKVGRIVKVSEEFLQDSVLDIESYLAKSLAKSIAKKEDEAFTKGKMSNPQAKTPEGFIKRDYKKNIINFK